MKRHKTIALVAHDNRKNDLIEWAKWNGAKLSQYKIVCTGTTGSLIETALANHHINDILAEFSIAKLKSGPLGGDQQLGAMIAEGGIDMLVFFWDPMEPQSHDVDVKALLRIATVYNIPTATNRSTADFLISSPLLDIDYKPHFKDYKKYAAGQSTIFLN